MSYDRIGVEFDILYIQIIESIIFLVVCIRRESFQVYFFMLYDIVSFGNIYEFVGFEEDIFIIYVFKVILKRYAQFSGKNLLFSLRVLVIVDDVNIRDLYISYF